MSEKPPITLNTPIQYAKGVGDKRAAQFAALDIKTCGDLLFHLPRDYLHFTDEAPVAAMRVGDVATVRGTILQTRMHGRKRGWGGRGGGGGQARLEALLEDASGTGEGGGGRCVLTWFNPYDLAKKLLPGTMVRVTGKVTMFRNRNQIVQGKLEFIDAHDAEALKPKSAHIEPVYPATLDLPSPVIWRIAKGILDELIPQIEEWFPRRMPDHKPGDLVYEGTVIQKVSGSRFICHSRRPSVYDLRALAQESQKEFTKAKDAAEFYLKWELNLPGRLDSWIVE